MKRKPIIFTVILAALGGVIWTACQKSDTPNAKTADDRTAEKFFNSYNSSKPSVIALQQYAQRENNRLPFVKQMMKKAGIPRWDKALVFEDVKLSSGRAGELGENTTVVHVPMVPENDSMVRGSLMVRMSPEDTVMNLVAAQDYASYGFGTAPAGGWNAHDVFNVLTKLDYMVFGRTAYRVTDGRLIGDSQNVNYKVTINPVPADPALTELFVTLNVCHSQTVCIIAGDPGSSPGVCSTYTYCTTFYIEVAGGGSGGGTGGTGGGGGPTGGGGTGGNGGPIGWEDWEDQPGECNMTCEDAGVLLQSITTSNPNIISYSDGPISLPDGEGIERKPKVVEWEFLTINFGLSIHADYSAFFKGVVFRSNTTSPWKWETITYDMITQTGGYVPPCTSVSPSASVAGPVISSDKLKATASMTYLFTIHCSCLFGVQTGTKAGSLNGQQLWAN